MVTKLGVANVQQHLLSLFPDGIALQSALIAPTQVQLPNHPVYSEKQMLRAAEEPDFDGASSQRGWGCQFHQYARIALRLRPPDALLTLQTARVSNPKSTGSEYLLTVVAQDRCV